MEQATETDPSAAPLPPLLTVGDWTAEPTANRLRREGEVRRLEPKVMEVLVCMARRPGETVSRETFMAEVWTGTVVTDDVLARCISALRKAFGDSARQPRYIETIRKRGYRLIAPVTMPTPRRSRPLARRAPEASGDGGLAPRPGALDGQALVARPAASREERRAALVRRRQRRRLRAALWSVAALGLVGAGAYAAVRIYTAQFRPLVAVPVTSLPGVERDPALSPDGQRVAFAWDGGGGDFDVYVQSVASGEGAPGSAAPGSASGATPLTDSPADDHSPAWSPDGRRVAFARCTSDGCAVYTADATPEAPGDASSARGRATRLSDLDRFQVRHLVWSPDGRQLAFSGRQGGSGAFSLHLLPLDGGPPQRLTAPPATYPGDLDPAFNSDGTRLAFVRTALDGRQDVCTVPVAGGTVTRLVLEQKGVTGLDWSADGRSLVYAANRAGAAGLWRIGAEGGAPRWIALGADGGEVSEPSLPDEGAGIAFARRQAQTQIVGVYAGGQPVPLVASTREDTQPDVSPDGRRIAFISTRSGAHEVWVAAADGSAPRRLTSFDGPRVSTPRWSPDGQRVVAAARRAGGGNDLFVIGLDGEVTQLPQTAADEVSPTWSRDGEHVYFASPRAAAGGAETWQIYKMAASGGTPEIVTRYGGVAAREASDGALLVVRPDRKGLWRLAPGPDGLPRDNRATRLLANVAPADWANWTVDGAFAYVLERQIDGSALIVRVETGRNEREVIATVLDVPDQPGLAVLPGGERVLVTQVERGDSDIAYVPDFR